MFQKIVVGSGLFGILVCLVIFGSCQKATAPKVGEVSAVIDAEGHNVLSFKPNPPLTPGDTVQVIIKINGTEQDPAATFSGLMPDGFDIGEPITVPVMPYMGLKPVVAVNYDVGQVYSSIKVYASIEIEQVHGNMVDISISAGGRTWAVIDVAADDLAATLIDGYTLE